MTFKQNDQSTCQRQIKLDTRDQIASLGEKERGKMASSYCDQCRMCVRLNGFFLPIQAKRGANKERESEKKRQNVTIRQHYYTGHAQIVFKSVHFLFLFYFWIYVWLTLTDRQIGPNTDSPAVQARQAQSNTQKGTERIFLSYLSHVWDVSQAGTRPRH